MNYGFGVVLFIGLCVSYTSANPPCICARNELPVCGSDGQTYSNECMLQCQQQINPELTLVKNGECSHQSSCICTLEYAPVCGNDGNTYPNECALKCEQHVELLYRGECIQVQDPCTCTRNLLPVCGTDGQTYGNKCLLNCARHNNNNNDLDIDHEGACAN